MAMIAATTAGTARAGLIGGLLNGNCPAGFPVFAPWGDSDSYYFAPNGGFESGSADWSFKNGASIVSPDNEPWYIAGFGSKAAQIPAGGTVSTTVCNGLSYPGARFFAAGIGGPATIHVRVIAHSLLGILSILDGGSFTVDQGWNPAPKVSAFWSSVAAPLGTKSMTLEITVESGTAEIDDLFVDPFQGMI